MTSFRKLFEFLAHTKLNKSESLFLSVFQDFIVNAGRIEGHTQTFSKFDYLSFHSYVKSIKSTKGTYNTLTTVRKLLTQAYENGFEFEINPKYFAVPPKPNAKHFEPLPQEELETLKEFLESEITKILA